MKRLITLLLILPALAAGQSRFGHGGSGTSVSSLLPIIADSTLWHLQGADTLVTDGALPIKVSGIRVSGTTRIDGTLTLITTAAESLIIGAGGFRNEGGLRQKGLSTFGTTGTTITLYPDGSSSFGSTADTTGYMSFNKLTDEPMINFANAGRNYILFKRASSGPMVTFGALGNVEANTSYNMDYRGGVHTYYDNTKNATWTALNQNGFAVQFAPRGLSDDIWSNAGALCLFKADSNGYGRFEKANFFILSPNDTLTFDYEDNTVGTFINAEKYIFDNTLVIPKIETTTSIQSPSGSNPSLILADVDVTNPFSSIQTNTRAILNIGAGTSGNGGALIDAYSENGSTVPLVFRGFVGGTSPTAAAISFRSGKLNGTSSANLSATEKIWTVDNITNTINYYTMLGNGFSGFGTSSPAAIIHANNNNVISNPLFRLGRDKNSTPDSLVMAVTGSGKVSFSPNTNAYGMTPADTLNLFNILGKKSSDSLFVVHNDIVGRDSVFAVLPTGGITAASIKVGNSNFTTTQVDTVFTAGYVPRWVKFKSGGKEWMSPVYAITDTTGKW